MKLTDHVTTTGVIKVGHVFMALLVDDLILGSSNGRIENHQHQHQKQVKH